MAYFDERKLRKFLKDIGGKYIHASNIQKKLDKGKHLSFLFECADRYKIFHEKFNIDDIDATVISWNEYLNFVQKNNKFSPQSKFESTILEESVYRMFSIFENEVVKIGNIKAYSNLYFSPIDFVDFKERSVVKINTKDQDFAIYKRASIKISDSAEDIETYIPVVAMECKTYLDKTMLEGSIATAEKIKNGNPYCRFCIVTGFYEVDKKVDIKHSRIDQIYVLNKDAKRKDNAKSSSISPDVIKLIFDETKEHLDQKWSDVEQKIKTKGVTL
ncbi:hypothetical protein FACS189443_6070 [Planctomycetales bacterium]|nr:hypothetical protein FACS189443_6070 [Planctomycetales bacterium]